MILGRKRFRPSICKLIIKGFSTRDSRVWRYVLGGVKAMFQVAGPSRDFSLTQVRGIVKDLFEPKAAIYWADFLLSFGVGAVCFHFVRRVPTFSVWQIGLFAVAGILYYRAALFIHELAHFREKSFRAFRITWNLLCGIPFLMPSFMYYTHVDHHMRKHFGTDHDGEYLALGTTPPHMILLYLLQPLYIPVLAVVRFLVLAPLAWMIPNFRAWVQQKASSLVMDPSYIRPLPTRKTIKVFRMQEIACFLFVFGAAVLFIRGRLPISLLVQGYLTSVFILTMNHIRTLGAHRYTNPGGELTFVEQLLDSVNYPTKPVLGSILMPVGLRFHALHHLCPSLPYHNLGEAHRRLMEQLPENSPYRKTVSPGLTTSLVQLWRAARAARSVDRRSSVPRPLMGRDMGGRLGDRSPTSSTRDTAAGV
jgi:fatty acid desaturase